ncbi:sterol desaturase family protein [Photorhabdus sp. P32]|uniref:sterol desaturase family protein n=1 Tax=Photorhabdus sp. P32 TaxID=3117549 RepID=UPI00311B40FD
MENLSSYFDFIYQDIAIPFFKRLTVFFAPSHGLFIGYLFMAFLIAVLFYAYKNKTVNPLKSSKMVVKAHKLTSKSSKDDFIFYFVDKIVFGFTYALILSSALFFKEGTINLLSFIGIPHFHVIPGIALNLVLTLGAIIVFDFSVFFEHFISHKIRVLWEFHKIHHIAENLTPLTAYRSHPVNQGFFILIASLFTGIYAGGVSYFFNAQNEYIIFAGQNVFMFLLLMFGLNLQHSMVYLRYPPFIRDILVSPAYHQLHHSSSVKHHDKNFGFIFSFWDRLFKTQIMPQADEVLTFGATGEKYDDYSGVKNMYVTPFKRIVKRLKKMIVSLR